MIVCVCKGVTDRQIRDRAAAGARSMDDLAFELGVATQCGRCHDCASRVLVQAQARPEASVPKPVCLGIQTVGAV